jgi:hypothetical protein
MYSSAIWAFNSSRIRWAVYVARVWERKYVCRRLVGTVEGMGSLGRHWRRWEDIVHGG